MQYQYDKKNHSHQSFENEEIHFDYNSVQRKPDGRKKNIVAMLAVCILAVISGNAVHSAVFEKDTAAIPDTTDSDYISNNNQSNAMIATGYSIDGVQYSLDATVQDYLDYGWSLSFDEGDSAVEQLEPDAYVSFSLYQKDISLYAHVYNDSDQTVDLNKLRLYSISITDSDGSVMMPYGLKMNMSSDEVEQILTQNNLPWSKQNNYSLEYHVDLETRREEESEYGSYQKNGYNDLNIILDEDEVSYISWYVNDGDINTSISVSDY